MLLHIVGALFGLAVLGFLALMLYAHMQPTKNVKFDVEKRTKAKLTSATADKICFEVEVPYHSYGKDESTILDAFVRPYLCQEQYDGALLRGKVNKLGVPREDDYFEACLVPPKTQDALVCKFELTPLHAADAYEALRGMPEVDVALYVEERGRKALYDSKYVMTLTPEELQALL